MLDVATLTPITLAVGLAAAFLIYTLVLHPLYNVYLHPLHHIPGPFLARASTLPLIHARLTGQQPLWIHSLHEKYASPVVRVAPNELSYISGQAWKDITGFRVQGRGALRKDPRFYGEDVVGHNGIIWAGDADHGRQRRLLSHAFSDKALRAQEPLLRHYADLLISRLHAHATSTASPVNLVAWLNYCTFDIMADLTYSESLHQLDSSKYSPWVSAIFENIKAAAIINALNTHVPGFKSAMAMLVPKKLMEGRQRHGRNALDRIDRRLENGGRPTDIMSHVLGKTDEKGQPRMSVPEMQSNSSLLMLAGTETTATLLSGLSFQLMKNPAKFELLKKEVGGLFEGGEKMEMKALERLPYMAACIEEAFRMYPPVPTGLSRLTGEKGDVICDEFVPPNTVVYVTQWAAYRNSRNWHRPDDFIPERWLPNADPVFAKDEKSVLQPFSTGPRNCLGKNLAYHEMRMILANMIWYFDWQLEPESDNWADQKIFTLWEKHPLMTRLTPRVEPPAVTTAFGESEKA